MTIAIANGMLPGHEHLGRYLTEGAGMDTWIREAGLNWRAEEREVVYRGFGAGVTAPHHKALVRSDTGKLLSIVSDKYRTVQPAEILDFYQKLSAGRSFKMISAGCLRGGLRIFAYADTDIEVNIGPDKSKVYALFSTGFDGKFSTLARLTTFRLWCLNQLTTLIRGSSGWLRNQVTIPHRTAFDVDQAVNQLSRLDYYLDDFRRQVTRLTARQITLNEATDAYTRVFHGLPYTEAKKSKILQTKIDNFERVYFYAPGQGGPTAGTPWGLLNALTYMIDHKAHTRGDPENARVSALFGHGENRKLAAWSAAVKLAA